MTCPCCGFQHRDLADMTIEPCLCFGCWQWADSFGVYYRGVK
jgi:hypothetical protein